MIIAILRKLARKLRSPPDMLDICKCGHPFEEHDWGAYSNLRTWFTSACLVEDCQCGDFHWVKEGERKDGRD